MANKWLDRQKILFNYHEKIVFTRLAKSVSNEVGLYFYIRRSSSLNLSIISLYGGPHAIVQKVGGQRLCGSVG